MANKAAGRFDELRTQNKKMKKADDDDELPPLPLALDNDIIQYEILPRLPVKSTCRFKCVSKQWKLFLSSHMFEKMYRQLHPINNKIYQLLLLDKPRCKPLLLNLHGLDNPLKEADDPKRSDLVVASLDGLVCVASTKPIISLALWNPLTGAYYKLPLNPYFPCPYHPIYHVIGFYSDSSNDYKLLYLVPLDQGAYIYSQRLNSWRKIEFSITYYGEHYFNQIRLDLRLTYWSQATFYDHSLYFWVESTGILLNHECIVCFDVNTEDFRIIQLPPLPRNLIIPPRKSLVVIDGCIHLHVAYIHRMFALDIRKINMWKLINGDSWVEVAIIADLSSDIPSPPPNVRNARDSWLAIMGDNNNSLEIMDLEEEFTSKEHLLSSFWFSSLLTSSIEYSRIIYEEMTLVCPNPPP